jgi:hypothetical protein
MASSAAFILGVPMIACQTTINFEVCDRINLQRRLTKAAPISPYIPLDGFMFTDAHTKYCNQGLGSLRRTLTLTCWL